MKNIHQNIFIHDSEIKKRKYFRLTENVIKRNLSTHNCTLKPLMQTYLNLIFVESSLCNVDVTGCFKAKHIILF